MSRVEAALFSKWAGSRIVAWSFLLGGAAYLPLQLYIWFGPADGNPIGLGLLAILGVPISLFGAAIGAVKVLVEHFDRRDG